MTFVHVNVHRDTHTCPAFPDEPHAYDTRRTIVAVVEGGPCRRPVTVRSGNTTAAVACGRHEPAYRPCPACRLTVVERSITVTHHGYQGPQHPTTDAHPGTGVAA